MTPRCLKRSSCKLLGWHKDDSTIHALCCYGDTKMPRKFMLHVARVTPRCLKSSRCKLLGGHQDDATVHVACARMTPIWLKSSCCVLLGWHQDDSKVHVSCGKGDSTMTQKFSFDECVLLPLRAVCLVFVYFWQPTKIFWLEVVGKWCPIEFFSYILGFLGWKYNVCLRHDSVVIWNS